MFPFILNQGQFVIPTFFFMIMLGAMSATFYLYFLAPRKNLSQIAVLDIAMIGTLFGVIGGRLFHIFAEAFWFYKENPWRVFEFWRGGFVSYGAFIGVFISIVIYLKIRKLPILEYVDFVALACPLVIFFVRVGCLGAGCCYGKPTHFPIHLIFDNPASDAGSKFPGMSLHATQIYDMLNAIFIFIVINWRYKHKKFSGEILLWFLSLYAFFRGLIEILRGDLDRGVYLNGLLSTAQVTGMITILLCLIVYFFLSQRASKAALKTNG